MAGDRGAGIIGLSAPSGAIARELGCGYRNRLRWEQERGVACFTDDFEAYIAHFRFP